MPKLSKARKAKGYTADDMRAVSDNPEWTKSDFARARSFDEVFPALARKRRGKQKAPTKIAISLRLDPDVLEAYQADGEGWQSRINRDLRRAKNLD
ncbi:MAG: BrnA antitoxin family protein [Pseudorhodoplanes sp.]